MNDRNELLEAALDSRPDGIALLDEDGQVVFWNRAAEAITGYTSPEVLAHFLPAPLGPLVFESALQEEMPVGTAPAPAGGALVHVRHKLGHGVPSMARRVVLRNALGEQIGMAVAFHPAESLDALPHGSGEETGENENLADFEERLHAEFDDFSRGGPPFGVLLITVDQEDALRKSHGAGACRAMHDKVRRALAQGLRPTEQMGRWGGTEFLIVAHERTAPMLLAHAQKLVGLARTADFRWWGDRVSVSASIGAAQASRALGDTLAQLLQRARVAMENSMSAGGNRVTVAASSEIAAQPGDELVCSPS